MLQAAPLHVKTTDIRPSIGVKQFCAMFMVCGRSRTFFRVDADPTTLLDCKQGAFVSAIECSLALGAAGKCQARRIDIAIGGEDLTHHGMRFNEIFTHSFECERCPPGCARRYLGSAAGRASNGRHRRGSRSGRGFRRSTGTTVRLGGASCLRACSGGLGANGFAQVFDYLLGKFLCRGRNVKMRPRENVGPEATGGEFLP
jgi:hypothetical protein